MASVWKELNRRNVVRVALAYLIVGWLILQVTDLLVPLLILPEWVGRFVFLILLISFPLALFFAWAYELTPEGLRKEKEVDSAQSISKQTGRKLDRLIIVFLGAAVVFLLADRFLLRGTVPTDSTRPAVAAITDKSVAVLPFVAMSDGPDDEYFADGLTEEILNSLAQLPELLVTARTSAFSFKGKNLPVQEIGETLGVAHIVEGSVRRANDQLRITVQLVRANDGFHLWSDTYDRAADDTFTVQADIAEKIASTLGVLLNDEQRNKMRSTGLRNPEAFIAFQKGVELLLHAHQVPGVAELLQANEYFERTIELEPEFSPAYMYHSDYFLHVIEAIEDPEGAGKGDIEAALEEAVSDLENAANYAVDEAQRLNATLDLAMITGQWRRMPELIDAAIRWQGSFTPSTWMTFAQLTVSPDLLEEFWQKEVLGDPLTYNSWSMLANTQIAQGDFHAAIETATRGMRTAQHLILALQLVNAHIAAGQFDEAEAASHRYLESERFRQRVQLRIVAAQGDAAKARGLMDEIIEDFGFGSVSPSPATISISAITGDRHRTNQLAAMLDARPLGIINLAGAISSCRCGAPFDLEETPNFARMIEETGIPWPPPSPINWPLKDW
jgi:TolB-like protein